MFITGYEITKQQPEVDYDALGIKMSDDEPAVFNIILKKIVINMDHIGAVGQNAISVPHISDNDVYDVLIQGAEITFLPIGEDVFKHYFEDEEIDSTDRV